MEKSGKWVEMTYQHQGKRYVESINGVDYVKKRKIIKQFFMIQFECTKCQKRHRLKKLKIDPMRRFRCQHCNNVQFIIVQQQIGESMLKKSDNIVMIEEHIIKRVNND